MSVFYIQLLAEEEETVSPILLLYDEDKDITFVPIFTSYQLCLSFIAEYLVGNNQVKAFKIMRFKQWTELKDVLILALENGANELLLDTSLLPIPNLLALFFLPVFSEEEEEIEVNSSLSDSRRIREVCQR